MSKRSLEIKAGKNVPYQQIAQYLTWELKLLARTWSETSDFKCDHGVEIHIIKRRKE